MGGDPVLASIFLGGAQSQGAGYLAGSQQAASSAPPMFSASIGVGSSFDARLALGTLGAAVLGLTAFYVWTREHQA